jgi:hypothetical protein
MTRSTGGRSPIPRPLQLGEISVTRSTSSSPSALSSDAKQDNRRPMPLRTRTIDRQSASSPHSPLTTDQRRQSSISYYSPTAESLPPSSPLAGPGPSSLSRSKSVGQRPKPARNDSLAKRASVPSRAVLERAEERGPLTLVEKCALVLIMDRGSIANIVLDMQTCCSLLHRRKRNAWTSGPNSRHTKRNLRS